MAYSFPPRGFTETSNNQPFPPNFGWPPFPPPWQSPQASLGPPWDYSAGPDMPPFPGGGQQFGPQVRGRFSHLNAHGHDGDAHQRPSEQGMMATGVRAAEPGAAPGQRHHSHKPAWFHHPPDRTVDITECETWTTGSRKNLQNFSSDGQHSSKPTNQPQNCTKGRPPPTWKNKPSKKSRRGKGCSVANQEGSSQLEHYCDVCDRGFKLKELLDEHIAGHVKCQHEGCKFEAHSKVVKLHSKLQHNPGCKRVAWLETPAEIIKWRDQRKRNYPSLCNITKKTEAMQCNEEKGAVLQNKYFGKMRRPKRRWQRHNNSQGHDGIDEKKARVEADQNKEGIFTKSNESHKDTKSETVASPSTTHHQGVVASCGHLGSLSALIDYGDSSEEEEGEIKDDTPKPEAVSPPQKPLTSFSRRNEGRKPGWKGFKGKKMARSAKADQRVKKRQENEVQQRLKKRPNLLEMLLAQEIRRERNIILQCVRHVIQNDFFGVNQTKDTKQELDRRLLPGLEEESGGILEESEGILEEAERILKNSEGTLEKSGGTLEKSGGTLNKSGGTVEESGGTVEESGGTVEESGGTVEESEGTVEESETTVEESGGVLKESGGALKESGGAMEESVGTLKEFGGIVEESRETVEESAGTVEESGETMEESKGIVEESEGTVEESSGTLEESGGTLQKSGGTLKESERILKESVKEESTVESPEMSRNSEDVGVSLEDSHIKESKEKGVGNSIASKGSNSESTFCMQTCKTHDYETDIPNTNTVINADMQMTSQEVTGGILIEESNEKETEKDDSSKIECEIGTDAVLTYRKETTDGIDTEVQSATKIGCDVEKVEVCVNRIENSVFQNGDSCGKV